MAAETRTAVVAGAGIGGVAAGIALADAGFEVRVYERAEEFRPLGAGLSLWPNGVRALRSLGADGWIERRQPQTGDAGIRRGTDGGLIAAIDPGQLEARFGAPLLLAHRADLHGALLERLGNHRVSFGTAVASASSAGDVELSSGESVHADVVVGADGIDSVVRGALLGDEPTEDSGIVAYRGVVPWEAEAPAGEYWGRGEVFGVAPLGDGRVYWYAAFRDADLLEPFDPAASIAALRERYAEWAQPVPGLLEATPAGDLLRHDLRDRPPVKRWGEGSATLLGDAAHPMLPFLGQGACSALEDAVALGDALSHDSGDTEAGLRAYETERIPRARLLVKGSRTAARAALLSGPAARARELAIAAVPQGVRLRQLDKLLGRPFG